MLVTKQCMGKKINCNWNLVTKILQNIFFHTLQNKESHAGLEQHEIEFMMTEF